jgi:ABC-type nitrate/sulfonate/bicarbonate transport system permease component
MLRIRGRPSLVTIASLIAFVLLWFLASVYDVIPYLPTPIEVLDVFVEHPGPLLGHALHTLVRGTVGLVIGSALGVLVALFFGWNRYIRAFLMPTLVAAKSIPVLALIPIFILWFGIGEKSIVPFVVVGCFFIVVVISIEAIANVPKVYLWAAAAMGASSTQHYTRVILPAIVPGIVGGLRVAAASAFPLTLAAEFLGAQQGLGYYIIKGVALLQVPEMIAGVIGVTALAIAADAAVRVATGRLTSWSERAVP